LEFGGKVFIFAAQEGDGKVDQLDATPGSGGMMAHGGKLVGGYPEFEMGLRI
jgi:hypothetical protein